MKCSIPHKGMVLGAGRPQRSADAAISPAPRPQRPLATGGSLEHRCRDCRHPFQLSESEARWYETKGLRIPTRCQHCRRAARQASQFCATIDLDEREREALTSAAAGLVSGSLSEWPYLRSAFETLGWRLPLTLGVEGMKVLAAEALRK